jgi:hypothetical protein
VFRLFVVLYTFFVVVSGLAVEPSHDEMPPAGSRDAVFGLAQNAGTVGEGEQIRRTITMVRATSLFCPYQHSS